MKRDIIMKFGIFDHVDRSDLALVQQLDERLEFLAAADGAGFYCYHVAEHHATPLNLVPVPGVYLGAVANATRRMRLGPMVYLLPLYSPLRLIEEICMLDHLSHGRLDVGVGRGVSPFELNYHNIDAENSREVFLDAFAAVTSGLTHQKLDYAGKHYSYSDVPTELTPLQRPHPPFWYPSSNADSSAWSGSSGYNFLTLGSSGIGRSLYPRLSAGLCRLRWTVRPGARFPGRHGDRGQSPHRGRRQRRRRKTGRRPGV